MVRLNCVFGFAISVVGLVCGSLTTAWATERHSGQVYYAYVACESEDEVALIRLSDSTGDGARLEVAKRIPVGLYDLEIEGPHGIAVSLDGKSWFLSLAHGRPFGSVYKYATGTDTLLDQSELGMFPASMQISSATGLLHVVNFNLHGDHEPSSVSVVDPEDMSEVDRIAVGVMPHGSRFTPDGLKHYSLSMMTDELFEIDAVDLKVSRKLTIDATADDGSGAHTDEHGVMHAVAKPTWVQLHPQKPLGYVACNGSDEVVEIDLTEWKIIRRFETGKGPYNVEVTPDGRKLVVTYKSAATTGVWDIESGKELARLRNCRSVPHGIAITPDSRYAIVTVEGKGSQPGGVDAIDLNKLEIVGTVDVGKQAGGIALWKTELTSETNN